MVQEIQGDGGLSPSQKKMLSEEYKQAAEGFQAALDKYSQLDLPGQKEECKEVMGQYMHVMQQVATDLHREKLLRQTSALETDFKALGQSDTAANKLKADLEQAKGDE